MTNKKIFCIILSLIFVLPMFSVRAEGECQAIAVMYHMVSDEAPSGAFCITSEAFDHDIKTLCEQGYVFCTADELQNFINEKRTGKFVAITFDDGYKSDVETVLPILKKYNAKATFFIIGSLVNTPGYVTESDLQTLAACDAVQIGNHTYEMHGMPRDEFLMQCLVHPDNVLADIEKNSKYLESVIDRKITTVSFPYGVFNSFINSQLRSGGYVTFSTEEKSVYSNDNIFGRYNRDIKRPVELILSSAGFREVYKRRFTVYPPFF